MERAVPVLPVDDLTVARQFHADGLGFDVSFEVRYDDGSGLLGVRRGTIAITLDCPMTGHGRAHVRSDRPVREHDLRDGTARRGRDRGTDRNETLSAS